MDGVVEDLGEKKRGDADINEEKSGVFSSLVCDKLSLFYVNQPTCQG